APVIEGGVAVGVVRQLLDHVAVEVEEIEIRFAGCALDGDQVIVVGCGPGLGPAARGDLGELASLEPEDAAPLRDEHGARKEELGLGMAGEDGMRGDLRRGLERSQVAVDTKAETAHEQEEHSDPEPANQGKYWCAMGRIRFQLGSSALCIRPEASMSRPYR